MSHTKKTKSEDLNKIKKQVVWGDVTRIANRCWVSPSHVTNVLAGRRFNSGVVAVAKMYAKENKASKRK